jgi:hypothetical protein
MATNHHGGSSLDIGILIQMLAANKLRNGKIFAAAILACS